eukprot:TRINITY_DN1651_c0_g1_i1.p1 TRINITY_DN1651_c0_g1~~TRINITY_DN1651_c0_g1_i1.p1  ORF type:complete len:179 (-),score=24.57 TRINITY_DN1651_c0_g1_i1:203-739(-)
MHGQFPHHPPPYPPFEMHYFCPFFGRHGMGRNPQWGEQENEGINRTCMRTRVLSDQVHVMVFQPGASEENTQVTFENGRIVIQGWAGTDCTQFYHSSLLPRDIVPGTREVVVDNNRIYVSIYRSQQEPAENVQDVGDNGVQDVQEMSGVQQEDQEVQNREDADIDEFIDILEDTKLDD